MSHMCEFIQRTVTTIRTTLYSKIQCMFIQIKGSLKEILCEKRRIITSKFKSISTNVVSKVQSFIC